MAAVSMAAVSMAEDSMAEDSMAEVFTTGPFPAGGDFWVTELDMTVSSTIPTQAPEAMRRLSLLSRRVSLLFCR
jgi:hypothetical protein